MTRMAKVYIAEYDAVHNELRLAEPLEGVRDGEKITIRVDTLDTDKTGEMPDGNSGVLAG